MKLLLVGGVLWSVSCLFMTSFLDKRNRKGPQHPSIAAKTTTQQTLQLDVLSIGSQTRPEYQTTQQATWASHPAIRRFIRIDERDDWDQTCATTLQESDFDAIAQWCNRNLAKVGPNVSWLELLWRRFTFRKKFLTDKGSDPVKWLCAQRRPMAGIVQLLRSYSSTDDDDDAMPDYLAVVDDDTYLNVDVLQAHLQPPSSKRQRYVGAGCQIQMTTNYRTYTAVYYVGGSGVVMSRATIQQLLKPIDCSADRDPQQANICDQIQNKHLIGEHLYFQNGMSLLDLMEARAKAERFTLHQNWTKGFCFHSDFYFSIWVELYPLSTQPYVEPIRRESSLIYHKNDGHNPGRATHGDCLYTTDLPCNVNKAVSCHYQAPFMMYQAHQEWNATRSLVLQRKQQRSVSKQQLLITPRSFTNDPKNTELVRLSSPHEHGREALSLQIQEDLIVVVGGFVGGYDGYDSASSLIQFFNTTSQHWLPRDRCLHLPDGMGQTHQGIVFDEGSRFLYIISGQVDGGCSPATTRVVRIHVDNGGEWQQLPPLPMARYSPGAVLVPNPHDTMEVHLHVFGGASAQRDQTARNHWRLVLADGNRFARHGLDALQWEELEPVIDSGTHGRSFQHQGIIYHTAFCDLDQQLVRGTMAKCSARAKTMQRQELRHTSDGGLMLAYPTQFATHNNDAVLVAGHWSRLPDMPFPGCHCSMTKIADKMVFALGGIAAIETKKGSSPDPLRSIQVFDLSTHTWESALSLDPRNSMPNQPSISKNSHNLMLWADPIRQKLFGLRTNDTLFVSDFSLRYVDQKTRSSNGLAASFHHDRVQYLRMTRTRSIKAWMACLPDDHEYHVETPIKPKGYDDARLTWNFGKRDLQYPDMIAFPQSAQEVSTFIQCARRTGHHVCGRNGKHSFESDTCTYGLVIDVSNINGAEKTGNNTIRLGAGLTLGRVVMEVEEGMGHVVPMGHGASVGVTGLVLVGGQGILSRHLGLLSDYVSAVELVDAQGNAIRATRDNEHADYLWLARGGGSGVQHYPGIITTLELSGLPKFEVQQNDQPTYLTFRIDFQATIDAAVEMMMDWQKFYTDPAHIADPLFTRLTIEPWMMHESIPQRGTNPATNKTANAPTHYIQKKTVFLNVYFYGSPTLMAKFEAQYKDKIMSFVGGTGKLRREQRLSNLALHKDSAGVVGDRQLASGQHGQDLRTTWKGFSAVSNDSVGEDVFRQIAEGIFNLSPVPSKRWMELKPLRGAVQDRVPQPDTAFWHRDALWWFLTSTSYNDEFTSDDLDEAIEAHRQHHEAVIKKMGSSFGGCYAGYIDHGRVESPGRDLPLYYGNHSQRIMDIKMKRDPENLFRLYVPNARRNAPFTFLQSNVQSRTNRT